MHSTRILTFFALLALNSLCAAEVKTSKDQTDIGISTKAKKEETAANAKVTTGVFTGIEEGDYAHWKMKKADGEEVTYFILKPDASVEKVLENPAKFRGKKCKITWKESVENIPEAGGKMKIEQILSVEWL